MSIAFRLYRYAIAVLLVAVAVASLCRSFGFFIHDIYWTQEYLGGDKLVHVYLGAIVLHCLTLWFNPSVKLRHTIYLTALLLLVLLIEENLQRFSATRAFDWGDLSASYIGVAIMFIWNSLFNWLNPKMTKV